MIYKMWSIKYQEALKKLLHYYEEDSEPLDYCPLCTAGEGDCSTCPWMIMTECDCQAVTEKLGFRRGVTYLRDERLKAWVSYRIKSISEWISLWEKENL